LFGKCTYGDLGASSYFALLWNGTNMVESTENTSQYVHWTKFCSMVSNIFSSHSTHSSVENFHHLKQTTTVADYIQRFEELMNLMQMEYPALN
jgi:hypothetical protein